MKKFCTGAGFFDTDASDVHEHVLNSRSSTQHRVLFRLPDGTWVLDTRHYGSHELKVQSPSQAATWFTFHGVDIPDTLIADSKKAG